MVTYNSEVYRDIVKIGSNVSHDLMVFIYNYEIKQLSNQTSLRLYLYTPLEDNKFPSELVVKVKEEFTTISTFYNIRQKKSKCFFGVLINIASADTDLSEVFIVSYKSEHKEFKFSNFFKLKNNQKSEEEPYNFIVEESYPGFVVYPTIEDNYWQCMCGHINSIVTSCCSNCSKSNSENSKFITQGSVRYTFEEIFSNNPISFNKNLSYQENLIRYYEELFNKFLSFSDFINLINPHKLQVKYMTEEIKSPVKKSQNSHRISKNFNKFSITNLVFFILIFLLLIIIVLS